MEGSGKTKLILAISVLVLKLSGHIRLCQRESVSEIPAAVHRWISVSTLAGYENDRGEMRE